MERWKDIPGYEDSYQVSNEGNIKSLERIVNGKRTGGRFLRPGISEGYFSVSLWKENKGKTVPVHRIVARAFLTKHPNIFCKNVNHIDGNKLNNNLTNLEWVTSRKNAIHSALTLRKNALIKDPKLVIAIRALIDCNIDAVKIYSVLDIPAHIVYNIKHNNAYGYMTKPTAKEILSEME